MKTLSFWKKARAIRAILFDIDGVLTNGGILYDDQGHEYKKFDVKDGMIVGPLIKAGFVVGAITGRQSEAVTRRSRELGLDFCYQGVTHKLEAYEKVKQQYELTDIQIAYIGDDLPDLPVLVRCGLPCAPADAVAPVRQAASYLASKKGGEGVLREVAEQILKAQGLYELWIGRYTS